MSSSFHFPFKLDNQDIWLNHTLNFYTICPFVVVYTTLLFTDLQIRATVPSTNIKQLYRNAYFPAAASAHLWKYGGFKKIIPWKSVMVTSIIKLRLASSNFSKSNLPRNISLGQFYNLVWFIDNDRRRLIHMEHIFWMLIR